MAPGERDRPVFVAIDLGAESGRVMLADLGDDRIDLTEIHRFGNGPIHLPEGLRWDVPRLWSEICLGLEQAAARANGSIRGIAVDSWGVDFALVDGAGDLLGAPAHYRDDRTAGMVEAALALVSEERLFRTSGIRTMRINTLFQLLSLARARSRSLASAGRMLMIPDLFGAWLSGRQATEASIASTSECLDIGRRAWAFDLLRDLGIPTSIFGEIVPAGEVLGPVVGPLAALGSLQGATVIAGASHDTAAAAAAVPSTGPDAVWISSGTWSIAGFASAEPVISEAAMRWALSNEIGADGNYLVCKTMPGLWLIEECRREWAAAGGALSYDEVSRLANESRAFAAFVDPEDDSLAEPGDMPGRIRALCAGTGQPVPETKSAILRCAFESLALQYRRAVDQLERASGRSLGPVHIVGGGSRNASLCQMTADALGRACYAGPVEATAVGNVLVQAVGLGLLGSLGEGRELVRRSFTMKEYEPRSAREWDEPYRRFLELTHGE